MAELKSTARTIDQLAASPEEREANGEFLFEGAGEVLKTYREARNLTLDDVGRQLHVHRSTVMRYEKNESPLSDYAVMRFAEVYDLNPESLMLECMQKVLPGMSKSPFGKLMARVIKSLRAEEAK